MYGYHCKPALHGFRRKRVPTALRVLGPTRRAIRVPHAVATHGA